MSILLRTESREIGGRTYQIRVLSFGDARKVYTRLQRLISANGDDAFEETGLGLFMFAGLAGMVNEEDLKLYCDTFGAATVCAMNATQTLDLSDDTKRTQVFAGCFEDMFEWLDACVEINFGGVMAKMSAAREQLKARRAAKAEAEKNK